jgi:hypothetical protein
MILRNPVRFSILAFLVVCQLAILGNAAKDPVVEKTDFEHAPRKYFYFDDSSVYLAVFWRLTLGDTIPSPWHRASF